MSDELKCCPRFTWGDGTHDLTCERDPGFWGRTAARLQREINHMRPVFDAAVASIAHQKTADVAHLVDDWLRTALDLSKRLEDAVDAAVARGGKR